MCWYELDEDGNRILDADGKLVFNAVPTTDWGSPETLEHWREAWAELCNAKFAEKGIDVRIGHRSYERQGVELLPTVHEGATVRAMEKKGIRTEKMCIRDRNIVIRKTKTLGHYGRLRKAYLEMHRPILFNELALADNLFEHCAETDEAARSRMELIVPELAKQYGVTEQLKAENQMEWVRQMNVCKAQAEEVVKAELIYN